VVSYITLFDKEHGFRVTGPFFLIIAAGIFISRIFAGQIFDRRGPYYLMIVGFSISIAGYLLLSLIHNTNAFLFSAFLIGIGSGILMPTVQAMVNNVVGVDRRGAANATITTAFDLGIGLGSLLLGFLADYIGFAGMYLSCTVLLAVGLGYYLSYVHGYYLNHIRHISAQ
jgi:MFS family permease